MLYVKPRFCPLLMWLNWEKRLNQGLPVFEYEPSNELYFQTFCCIYRISLLFVLRDAQQYDFLSLVYTKMIFHIYHIEIVFPSYDQFWRVDSVH